MLENLSETTSSQDNREIVRFNDYRKGAQKRNLVEYIPSGMEYASMLKSYYTKGRYRVVKYEKECAYVGCDNKFITRKRLDDETKEKKFCSKKCLSEHRALNPIKRSSKKRETKTYEYICSNCGIGFETKKRKTRTCSPQCLHEAFGKRGRSTKQIHMCKWCNKVDTGNRHKMFCSNECLSESIKSKSSYVDPYAFHKSVVESFGRKVRYHRFIMEQKLGRKLERNEIVHHIDGNKHNNELDNLMLLSSSEHAKLHFNKRDIDPITHKLT